jgi:hypothetical protein
MSSIEVTKKSNKTVVVSGGSVKQAVEVHDPGVAGPPNTLSVGTVTTGNTPAVTISGQAPSQTIDFVIPVGGSYIHTQNSPATTWTVVHNLGFFPNVTVSDSAGTILEGQVEYPNVTTIVLTFSAAFSGKAYLS